MIGLLIILLKIVGNYVVPKAIFLPDDYYCCVPRKSDFSSGRGLKLCPKSVSPWRGLNLPNSGTSENRGELCTSVLARVFNTTPQTTNYTTTDGSVCICRCPARRDIMHSKVMHAHIYISYIFVWTYHGLHRYKCDMHPVQKMSFTLSVLCTIRSIWWRAHIK